MSVELIRELYDYHRWANRRLFGIAVDLGDGIATRDMGKHWSFPTIKGMFAHLYRTDRIWLSRWTGAPPARMAGDADFATMSELRSKWDVLEGEQRAFVEGLSASDLARAIAYTNNQGIQAEAALAPLLQHVVNHGTHHRSEIATMLTIASGSPPDTGIATYRAIMVKR